MPTILLPNLDLVQTFFVPKDRVGQSPYCFLTGIDVYFKNKPSLSQLVGIENPGAIMSLCEVGSNQVPIPEQILPDSTVRLNYDQIPLLQVEDVQTINVSSTTTSSTSREYDPIYKGVGFTAVGQTSRSTIFSFKFAAIDSVATLYFSDPRAGHAIYITRGGSGPFFGGGGSVFFRSNTRQTPGLSALTSADRSYLARNGFRAPVTGGFSIVKDNNIQGVGKITWSHDSSSDSEDYTISIGQGKNRRLDCFLQYASGIRTKNNLTRTPVTVKKITTTSRTYGSAAKFIFETPVLVQTDKLYGIMLDYEDPRYDTWTNVQGQYLIGTSTRSKGASQSGDGKYFSAHASGNDFSLKPENNKDLMFEVYAAKFNANTANVELVHDEYEFLTIDDYSANGTGFNVNEFVYQDYGNATINATYGYIGSGFFKSGTVDVSNNRYVVTGSGTTFTTDLAVDDYIVITDLTSGNTDVRQVAELTNSTSFVLDYPTSFSNSAAYLKKTAIAQVYDIDYGANLAILTNSNANASVKFQNSGIRYVTITAAGSGYDNTDVVTVYSGGSTLNAVANVTTDASGNIVSLNFSNVGVGFTSSPSIIISNSSVLTSNTSNGSGATLTANIYGGFIKGDVSEYSANIVSVDDYNISKFDPDIKLPSESPDVEIILRHNFANSSYYVASGREALTKDGNNSLTFDGIIASRSNEVASNTNLHGTNKSSVIKAEFKTNQANTNLYMSPLLHEDLFDVYTYKYDINNNSSNEITRNGSSLSKSITKKISFANNKFAEDVRVFMTAYKPVGTDILVYAKVYHTADNEAFDDKVWTPLELISGSGLNSGRVDKSDLLDLHFGFKKYPTTDSELSGTVTLSSGSTTLSGSGTTFTSSLANNDIIRIYNPLFSDTNYLVAVATTVTDNTTITINESTTNNSILGSGLKIAKVNTAHVQTAFTNPQNFNVSRYYNSTLQEFDGYNVLAVKIVLLSNSYTTVPEVEDIRVIGVSA